MARIRSIKPEFWHKYDLATAVSRDARLLYIALWNQADEHGRLHGDPRWIKGHCFPYDDDLNLAAIDRLLGELASAEKVVRYWVKGAPYLFLPNLGEHQRLEAEKVASKLPAPDEADRPTPDPAPSGRAVDQSDPRADSSAPGADSSGKSVASLCGMEHVAGSMGTSAPAEDGERKKPRPVDAVWDAVVEVCNIDPASMTASARGPCNRAVKELKEVGAEPEEIRRRAGHYHQRYPGVALTPMALSKHWGQLHGPPDRAPDRRSNPNPYVEAALAGNANVFALEAG